MPAGRIQDEDDLEGSSKGAEDGEGDLAQGGVLLGEEEVVGLIPWETLVSIPSPRLSTWMPRGIAASSSSSSRTWKQTMSTEVP